MTKKPTPPGGAAPKRPLATDDADLTAVAIRQAFAARLIALRKARNNMTQAQLAALSGISQPHISQLETASVEPRLYTLIFLAEALNIDPAELIPRFRDLKLSPRTKEPGRFDGNDEKGCVAFAALYERHGNIYNIYPSGDAVAESNGEGYTTGNMKKPAIDLNAEVAKLGYTPERALETLRRLSDTGRETTGRAKASPTAEQAPSLPSPKVQAVFGDVPPEFRTKHRTKLPPDVLHDPEVVQTAKDIVNANRRTKMGELRTVDPKAAELLQRARRIVRANEGLSSPAPAA